MFYSRTDLIHQIIHFDVFTVLSLKAILVNDIHSNVTEDLKKNDFHIFQMTQGDQYRIL